jgi:hypothetical protein
MLVFRVCRHGVLVLACLAKFVEKLDDGSVTRTCNLTGHMERHVLRD